MITDKLRSYGAAKRHVMASVEYRQSKYLNNRAENSHQRTRQHEYAMRRFKFPQGTPHGSVPSTTRSISISGHSQHQLDAAAHRAILHDRHTTWNQITGDLLTQAGVRECKDGPTVPLANAPRRRRSPDARTY